MNESILNSIKQMLGIDEDYEAFDSSLIPMINGALLLAWQLGYGCKIQIVDERTTWRDFLSEAENCLGAVQSFVYSRVKMEFDPPSSSVAADAMNDLASEMSWRLNIAYEEGDM